MPEKSASSPNTILKVYKPETISRPNLQIESPSAALRERFKLFLHNLPLGGIGLHGTATIFEDSIRQHGLNGSYFSSNPNASGAYFVILDPQRNLNQEKKEDQESIEATYRRLIYSIASVTNAFGIPFATGANNALDTNAYKAMLVVFSNARLLMEKERYENIPKILRRFCNPPRLVCEKKEGQRHLLPSSLFDQSLPELGYVDSVPPSSITGYFILDSPVNLQKFSEDVVERLIKIYSH